MSVWFFLAALAVGVVICIAQDGGIDNDPQW
jgi:hypothetical protein